MCHYLNLISPPKSRSPEIWLTRRYLFCHCGSYSSGYLSTSTTSLSSSIHQHTRETATARDEWDRKSSRQGSREEELLQEPGCSKQGVRVEKCVFSEAARLEIGQWREVVGAAHQQACHWCGWCTQKIIGAAVLTCVVNKDLFTEITDQTI